MDPACPAAQASLARLAEPLDLEVLVEQQLANLAVLPALIEAAVQQAGNPVQAVGAVPALQQAVAPASAGEQRMEDPVSQRMADPVSQMVADPASQRVEDLASRLEVDSHLQEKEHLFLSLADGSTSL